jgi:exosortase/archaeosortase family protein
MPSLLHRIAPCLCLLLLSVEPLWWLIGTWYLPGYEGTGALAFLLALVLLLWSASSPRLRAEPVRWPTLYHLLWLSLSLRVLGTLAGVNLINALVLPLDVFVLGRWLQLGSRQRALSPLWLAVAFAFCLPLEPLAQRTFGYPLQQLSAAVSCQLLGLWTDALQCQGVRMVLNGRELLVDLPCSGARLATQLGLFYAVLAALRRPGMRRALGQSALVLVLAVGANALRIAVLAVGAGGESGIDTMASPWHELIGLAALSGAAGVLWVLTGGASRPAQAPELSGRWTMMAKRPTAWTAARWAPLLAGAALLPSLGDGLGSAAPVGPQPLTAPSYLAGYAREDAPLSKLESAYFQRYGASARRASYGPYGLYMVRTRAPLRHLHAPEICLRGLGHKVRFLGTRYEPSPASIYESVAPDGQRYHVAVSYIASTGQVAPSIAEAVWRWFAAPRGHWTMVQQVVPATAPAAIFEQAVARAFNLAGQSAHPKLSMLTLKEASWRP